MTRALRVLALLVVCGCGGTYAYVPATNANSTMRGRLAADYPIPPSQPQGNLRIATYGIVDVSPNGGPNETGHALHLRVVLADESAQPWTFDTREQRLILTDGEALAPAFAASNPGVPPPVVTVAPGRKRVVDLFFLLPPGFQHAESLPEFDAAWRVDTGAGPVAERTPFDRLAVEPDQGDYVDWDYGDDYYWGGPYWMNPEFPFLAYGYAPGYFRGGVWIHRAPHFGHPWGGFHGGARAEGFHGRGGRR